MTIHAGIRLRGVEHLRSSGRLTGVVSRGGGLLASWMLHHRRENPLFERFDDVLDICRSHDVTISLGDALRPGSLHDATDTLQVDELNTLGDLVLRCRDSGVQSMVEGPGHVPLDQIETNVILQKRLCHGAPFYVLGPLVTDIAAGWDHITGAIGGALAGWIGVDYLCAVTPAEHLALPSPEEVYAGVMAFRVAAHAADVARRFPGAMERDHAMSRARFNLDWDRQIELAMDPHTMKEVRQERKSETRACTMCGPYCPMDLVKNLSDDEGSQESSD